MNWAWRQQLAPTAKLVLMSLADAADDHGVCWPSVPTVAIKCCVSTRTVRRIMQRLIARDLLIAESRYRPDGSCSSNRYRLQLAGGDNLSPAPNRGDTTSGHARQDPPDTDVSPGTTKGTVKESPQPPKPNTNPVDFESAESGCGELSVLEYPEGLSAGERGEARKKLAGLSTDLAQQLLDELAGRMAAGAIRVTSLAYLRGLIKKAHAGEFTPEVALRVAETRKHRRLAEAALRCAETSRSKLPSPEMGDNDNPLIQRLTAIRDKVQRRKRGNE